MKLYLCRALASFFAFSLFLNIAIFAGDDLLHSRKDAYMPIYRAYKTLLLPPLTDLDLTEKFSVTLPALKANPLNEPEWEDGSLPSSMTPKELAEYTNFYTKLEADWELVGGAGTFCPGSAGYRLQKNWRRLKTLGSFTAPFISTFISLKALNFAFDEATPRVARFIGEGVANFSVQDKVWLTGYIPGSDFLVRSTYIQIVGDEVKLRMADARDFCLSYNSAIMNGMSMLASAVCNKASSSWRYWWS